MENAGVLDILQEMDLTSLKEAGRLQGLDLTNKKTCAPCIAELERKEWDDQKLKQLVDILKKRRQGYNSYCSAQIVKSDDLPNISKNEIISNLKSSPPKNTREGLVPGFDDIESPNGEIKGTFIGSSSRIVIVERNALVEKKTVSVPFSIFREEGFCLIKTSNPKEGRLCREELQGILDLNKFYYAIPGGIRDEGAIAEDYNGRARGFITSLDIEEINRVFLKIDGETKITNINYKGNGDILEESKIKNDINKGALMHGVGGFIRHGELLLDFSIKWGWVPSIKISGEEISQDILDEVIAKIYREYVRNMLR